MRRTVSFKKYLPAFVITLSDLERFLTDFSAVNMDGNWFQRIRVSLDHDRLEFSSVEEMRGCDALPPVLREFVISISNKSNTVEIRSQYFVSGIFKMRHTAAAETYSTNEFWGPMAAEAVAVFIRKHTVWHSFLVTFPIGRLMIAYSVISPFLVHLFVNYYARRVYSLVK
jgi:hypothetical protein